MKLLCNSIKILEDRVEIHGPFIMQKIKEGERMVFIAEYEGSVKGQCTLVLYPTEGPWGGKGYPEIVDLTVFFDIFWMEAESGIRIRCWTNTHHVLIKKRGCKAQAIEHCISRSQLRAVIQMCVNVRRS